MKDVGVRPQPRDTAREEVVHNAISRDHCIAALKEHLTNAFRKHVAGAYVSVEYNDTSKVALYIRVFVYDPGQPDGNDAPHHSCGYFQLSGLRNAGHSVCVSHSLWLREDLRGKGLSAPLHTAKRLAAQAVRFRSMICTVNKDNAAEVRCLDKYFWDVVDLGPRRPLLGHMVIPTPGERADGYTAEEICPEDLPEDE